MTGFVYLWEFEVRAGREAEFELHYGPAGSWVRLFRTASGYVSTTLLKDRSTARRYVTIDQWESESAYRQFRDAKAKAFAELDAQCEALTVTERQVGHFDIMQ
jgi:heme-degrading monooxygenase HmoA